jgi:hypothetical protein
MPKLPWLHDKWGALEVVEKLSVYESGEGYPKTHYIANCDCGKTIEITTDNWAGKRATVDCGCGIGKQVRVRGYLRFGLSQRIYDLCRDNELGHEDAVSMILEAGLIHLGYGDIRKREVRDDS